MRNHVAGWAVALLVFAAAGTFSARAQAATSQCAQATVSNASGQTISTFSAGQTPASAPGGACWTDVLPYPFGTDGNQVMIITANTASAATLPTSALQVRSIPIQEQAGFGSLTVTDSAGTETLSFGGTGVTAAQCGGVPAPCLTNVTGGTAGATIPAGAVVTFLSGGSGSAPATSSDYQTVTSLAFRAWNRGLAATSSPDATAALPNPYGIWTYNGSQWSSVPYPGSATCPGNTVLWAGKLDYWLIGNGATLCRFDGVNDVWETLTAPSTAFPAGAFTKEINAGSCFAWDNCWFFGTDGAVVHWDGASLTPESLGLLNTPWLGLDYHAATAATASDGSPIGVAVGGLVPGSSLPPAQDQPQADPEIYQSSGGSFAPAALDPASSTLGDGPTDLVAVSYDSNGEGWVAGNSMPATAASTQYATIFPISGAGAGGSCQAAQSLLGASSTQPYYLWSQGALGALSDGSVLAGGAQTATGINPVFQPVLVRASCSAPAEVTTFQIPEPGQSPSAQPVDITADTDATIDALAASATNDAWAASTPSAVRIGFGNQYAGPPHLYQWTDGLSPNAPAGNDVESRPVVVTPSPTVFEFPPPVVVNTVIRRIKKIKKGKPKYKTVRLPPAAYDVGKPRLEPLAANGTYRLTVTFRVRRRVTMGLDAIAHGKVVARSGLRTFTRRSGALSVVIHRGNWPTGLKFVQPGTRV